MLVSAEPHRRNKYRSPSTARLPLTPHRLESLFGYTPVPRLPKVAGRVREGGSGGSLPLSERPGGPAPRAAGHQRNTSGFLRYAGDLTPIYTPPDSGRAPPCHTAPDWQPSAPGRKRAPWECADYEGTAGAGAGYEYAEHSLGGV